MIENLYLQSVIKRFTEYKTLGDKTLAQLTDAELLWKANEGCNSIAQIIQHLRGNMLSRWTNFLTEDGEKPWRQRDAEFEEKAATKQELLHQWEEGWQVLLQTLGSLQPADLIKHITIRTEPLLVVDAINRQLAHYSSHIGQIILIGKLLKGTAWQNLSIDKNASAAFNESMRLAHDRKQ